MSNKSADSASSSEPRVSLEALPLHSSHLLTVLDTDGIIQYESPSIERIYGFDQDDLVGEPVAEYFHPDDRDRVIGAFETIVASEDDAVEAVEYRHEQADGTYLWVESIASANPTPKGYYVVNTRDISEQKERERQLRATNERLDEFASVVSHDLRNPLNVARGRLELAQDDCDSKHLDSVDDALTRMNDLIADLLRLAQHGQAGMELESIDLQTAVRDCWDTIETAEATLETDVEGTIRGDPGQVKQLFENLYRNAVEHAGTTVTVHVFDLDDGFAIEDDGPGIPEADRTEVFTFGHSTKDEGTGLGLSIVKEIADAHEWTIDITTGSEGGAKFAFRGVEFAD